MKTDLTTDMIEAGRNLLRFLDGEGFNVRACFWFYFEESDRWRFVVASPRLKAQGPHAAYKELEKLARKVPNGFAIFGPGDVSIVNESDPLVRLLRKATLIAPGSSGVRFSNNWIDGTLVEDAYLYRLK